ncbi:MAG: hypothetical protein GEU28_07155 [Dehalococcoidia bacterium]|nr:hypothetical protein [Dehalococcoidia bacterium]
MDEKRVLGNVREIAQEFAAGRADRQRRRFLDPGDFERLADAGFLLTGVSGELGGIWANPAISTRPVAEILRALGATDPAVALVSAMHPAVCAFWLAAPEASDQSEAWRRQKRLVSEIALEGGWWGTITSEPGSGGDIGRTKATATPDEGDGWRLSGQKHFGSGSGIVSFMITTARPEGEDPDWFYLDVRDASWDGSGGMKLVAEWDGQGMTATQSHGFAFEDYPATRMAWPGHMRDVAAAAGPFIGCCFTAVVLGIIESAVAKAREQLSGRLDSLRPYERVEWMKALNNAWLMEQAYEGMLRAVEGGSATVAADVLKGKTACAELAEEVMTAVCRVIGGGAFNRSSPFGFWFEDVRALGFLRPPWGLAFDSLFELEAAR